MTQLGVDASSYEPVINWQTAAQHGIKFASIRASYGVAGVDGCHAKHMAGAKAAGIERIPYHWLDNKLPGLAQAQNFLARYIPGEYSPMLDLEDYKLNKGYHGISKQVVAYMDEIYRATNQDGIIYASPSYIKAYLYDAFALLKYRLIIAHWDMAYPLIPRPFVPETWLAWQYTGRGNGPYYGYTLNKQIALYVKKDE